MTTAMREKPARSLDLETGSNSSGPPDKKPGESGLSEDNKTTSSVAGEHIGEINYHTLSWW